MFQAPRALFLTGDESSCCLWRVWSPCAELQRRGYRAEWAHKDDALKVLPLVAGGAFDAIITPRIVWPSEGVGDNWIRTIHKAGLAWIYEIDDDVYSPRIVNRQMRLFDSERAKGETQLEWERQERIRLLAQCDGVTVSTERLATIVRRFAPDHIPVRVTPNAIDAKWFRETLKGCSRIPELRGHLTIGWAGGTREDVDVIPLAAAWSVLANKYPDVRFVVQGHIPQILADSVPKDQRVTLPWLPLEEYPRAMLNIDIGCCVVAPMVFNTSKSAIKWYEFTLAGAACVVSSTVYGREVTDGVNALVADSAEQLVDALSRLIEDQAYRRRIRRNARRAVMAEHSLQTQWWRWISGWTEILENFNSRPRIALPA